MPSERIGKAFVNHGFQITVTKVVHLRELPVDAESASGGVKPYVPLNGQFVVVYVTAKNVGKSPDTVSDTSSTLLDRAGNSYDSSLYLLLAEQGIGDGGPNQQPGTTRSGYMVFDVPTTVGALSAIVVQPDGYMATTNPPTTVSLK